MSFVSEYWTVEVTGVDNIWYPVPGKFDTREQATQYVDERKKMLQDGHECHWRILWTEVHEFKNTRTTIQQWMNV